MFSSDISTDTRISVTLTITRMGFEQIEQVSKVCAVTGQMMVAAAMAQ